tara:strand:- start:1705 stop:3822 length:2118 start_codon:yes stop_codon:yes gene_type:complete
MARTTLEMFIKLIGADKVGRALDSTSKKIKNTQEQVDKGTKQNAKFAAGMSGLSKTAIVGSSLLAVKALGDFSISAIQAASSAQEAAGAFGTTFGDASEKLNQQLSKNANLFGLTSSEAQQLISVFGSVAQGIGFTQEESADLSSELFDLAGDIASFNNITAGAAPVLQAFRSALVGEREALKTYGIAITEAEVQTKAFEQTGKDSADALTRQEKALATSALIFERSSVQQGNAAREASGFAAQMLVARSATTELQEEIGEELLPAAADLLGVFNALRETATPDLITKFGNLGLTIQGTVEAFERGKDSFDGFMDFFRPDDYEEFNKELRETNRIYTDGILGLRGLGRERRADKETTLELVKQLSNYASTQAIINKSIEKNRFIVRNLIPQNKKLGESFKKDLLPTLDRIAKIYGVINKESGETVEQDNELEEATNAVAEAQRKEALSTAEEALQKKQLQQEIAELIFFQQQGKNVTEELALAQERLKDVEFELTRESEELRDAKKNLAEVESDLESAVEDSNSAIQDQIDAINELQEVTDLFSSDDFKETLEALADSLGVSYTSIFNDIYAEYLSLLEKVNNKPLSVIISEQLEDAGLPKDFMIPDAETQKAIDEAIKVINERNEKTKFPATTAGGFGFQGEFSSARSTIDTGGSFGFLGEDVGAVTRAFREQEIKVTVDLADTAEDFLQVTEKRKISKGYAIT